jgi:hypothetical protein
MSIFGLKQVDPRFSFWSALFSSWDFGLGYWQDEPQRCTNETYILLLRIKITLVIRDYFLKIQILKPHTIYYLKEEKKIQETKYLLVLL